MGNPSTDKVALVVNFTAVTPEADEKHLQDPRISLVAKPGG